MKWENCILLVCCFYRQSQAKKERRTCEYLEQDSKSCVYTVTVQVSFTLFINRVKKIAGHLLPELDPEKSALLNAKHCNVWATVQLFGFGSIRDGLKVGTRPIEIWKRRVDNSPERNTLKKVKTLYKRSKSSKLTLVILAKEVKPVCSGWVSCSCLCGLYIGWWEQAAIYINCWVFDIGIPCSTKEEARKHGYGGISSTHEACKAWFGGATSRADS